MRTVRVWDVPTRLFHWLFALSFALAFIIHESDRFLELHVFAGYVFFGLLIFRLIWGVAGSRYARFGSFAFGVGETADYLKKLAQSQPRHYLGHNPAGAWAIFLLLGLGVVVAGSGVLLLGMEEGHGVFAAWFNPQAAEAWEELHEGAAFAMLFLVAIHLIGVIVSSALHHENLVRSMFTGNKQGADGEVSVAAHRWLGIVMLLTLLGVSAWYFQGYVTTADYRPFSGKTLARNATWQSECGTCHLAYHPQLLPSRSWERVLNEQAEHFGDDLALDEDTLAELSAFQRANAADIYQTEAAYKISRSIPATAAPLRISETAYWQDEHEDISDAHWQAAKSRANCEACHLDAEQGTFEDSAMRLPVS